MPASGPRSCCDSTFERARTCPASEFARTRAAQSRPTIKGETSMGLSYDEAVKKLHEWTDSGSLRNHARAVEVVMRRAAHRYGDGAADELSWAITGLLHDADYDRWPDEHPRLIV